MKSFQLKTLRGINFAILLCLLASASSTLLGQAPAGTAAPATNPNRLVGTITAVGSGQITVKTDGDGARKVTVPEGIRMQRVAPGEKDLSKAALIEFKDLAVGDRVLVRLAPDQTSDPVSAISIIAIPQADLAQKQQRDREDWQKRGVGGLVKSVNAGTGLVIITSGSGPTAKTITLHTTPATGLRRYAPDSVSFDEAKPAPLEVIQVGDQLRARGNKNEDGTEVAAEDIVSGSFRNIAGTVTAVNSTAMTLTVKDLTTKQTVTVHVGPEAQMRKLPEAMARMLASTTKSSDSKAPAGMAGGAPSMGAGAGGQAPGGMSPNGQAPGGQARNWNGGPPNGGGANGSPAGGMPGGAPAGGFAQGGRPGGDPQQMLSHAPQIHIADLQKGDAVMLVSTQGTTDVTAITLLAGVEPLLQSSATTQNMLLSNWNMSSGGADAAQ